uniref:Glu S.griseus protease inhibitor n=1 Tax=Momordica charantia TaxID=3673 RepID=BGIA_MOMCH|nr:RecName: Full=Glu S.griseus protease inhibitor; AltName: Full=BGIA [Momordica charantia]AAB19651.1 BGIA=acidic amino acid-specific endopeptidase inhibitor [Momordica charantia L.=bitter gourd, Peptide, 68 aa] [Momordica charantia]
SQCQGKRSWPQLVGSTGAAAKAVIERENPRVRAVIVRVGSPVTADFRCDRVRVWVTERGIVARPPAIG